MISQNPSNRQGPLQDSTRSQPRIKILEKFRSFTPGDWSMHIKLHNALSIERGGEESQPRPRRRWQHRRRKMRRRGWLRSAEVPERERQTDKGPRGYLVGAIRLLLAEPLDLLLELPDLLLHVHGAWDCRSLSISGLRPCPCVGREFLNLGRGSWQDISDAEEAAVVRWSVTNRRAWTV